MRYCKTIDKADYETSDLFQHVANMHDVMNGMFTPWATEYRQWEYGMVLRALRENGAQTVLDVGGGSSLFAAAATWAGHDLLVVDPENYTKMFQQQSEQIGKNILYQHDDFMDYPTGGGSTFDAVVCISVIEHVQEDEPFFRKLLKHVNPGGLLCLTTDFHPSGVAVFGGHNRTYNAEMLLNLISLAKGEGFKVLGEKPTYDVFEPLIHGLYSFASMVLKRSE